MSLQFEIFKAVYYGDIMLFIDLGGFEEANIDFPINNKGNNLLHLAIHRGK